MRINYAKVARRCLIGVIIIVLLSVLFNFLRTIPNHGTPNSNGMLDKDKNYYAEDFTHTHNVNGIAAYKVNAKRLVEYRLGIRKLESVEALTFNPDGSVRIKILSQKANYDKDHKLIDFSGDVRVFRGDLEMRTESLHYDLNGDVGTTPDLLRFNSHAANGKARGFRFEQGTKTLELASEAEFNFSQNGSEAGNSKKIGSMRATSQRAYSFRIANKIVFQGKAKIESKEYGFISADNIEVLLSPDQRHVTSLISSGKAVHRSQEGGETRVLSSDRIIFVIGESRDLEKIGLSGEATFVSTSAGEERNLSAAEIELTFDPDKDGALTQLQGRGGVQFRMKRGMEQTLISGEQLGAQFSPETKNLTFMHVNKNAKLHAEGSKDTASNDLQAGDLRVDFQQVNDRAAIKRIQAEGSVRWRSTPPKNSTARGPETSRSLETSRLVLENSPKGDYLESGTATGKVVISEIPNERVIQPQMRHLTTDSARFKFFPENGQLKEMNAEGHVQATFESKDKALGGLPAADNFRTASDNMKTNFTLGDDGRSVIQSAAQWGNFSYRDSSSTATAGRCDYEASKEVMLLTESPKITDESSSTTGERIDYDRRRKVLSVHGNVQSKMAVQKSSPKGGDLFFGSSSASASSQSIIMADEMRYERETASFRYSGHVRSISESQQLHAHVLDIFDKGERVEAQGEIWHLMNDTTQMGKSRNAKNSQRPPITIRSGRMQYLRMRGELHYSENVNLSSIDRKMSSANLEIKLDKDGIIENATASGKVQIVHQEGRECKGDIAHWELETDEYTVEGNPAEIYDPLRGRSKARQLTYYKGNDRILLGKQ
jgi:LPS export ABC transporter protein LptC